MCDSVSEGNLGLASHHPYPYHYYHHYHYQYHHHPRNVIIITVSITVTMNRRHPGLLSNCFCTSTPTEAAEYVAAYVGVACA